MVKVFSQSNLMDVIKCNENISSIGNNSSNSFGATFNQHSQNDSAIYNSNSFSFAAETSVTYMQISSVEVAEMVKELMKKVLRAQLKTKRHIEESNRQLHQKFGIFENIVKYIPFLLSANDMDSSITQEENRQIPEILDFVVNSFSHLFEVS